MRAQLAGETDFAGFRAQARALLAQGVPPDQVHWATSAQSEDLFAQVPEPPARPAPQLANPVAVPPAFLSLARSVSLHRDPGRFALLYRLLWRLAHEPALRHDPLDPDMLLARRMDNAVRKDIHKMRAFVRFRQVTSGQASGQVTHVAWFEPAHHIVQANAPWFVRRFAQMHWAILTPDLCASWDGRELRFQPGANRGDAPPADAGEALWLTYYQSIFNPARLKLAMMRKEMPRRYWHNLPEARLIDGLAAQAHHRSGAMIAQPATQPLRRIAQPPRDLVTRPDTTQIASLEDLQSNAQHCRRCPIGAMATQAVAGEGPRDAALMLVGEQPGDQEDLRGRPFVGPAGQLLDRALRQLGLARESLYLTNAVRHFKYELRGKRRIHKTPSQREAQSCGHWLEHEIALVKPKALVALGGTAAQSLLGRAVAVTLERGRWHERPDGLQVLVTLHPSALLRMLPEQQDEAFERFVGDLALAVSSSSDSRS